ncbi:hypothetical protein V6N13_020091 [Hibiscus sabdariffa]
MAISYTSDFMSINIFVWNEQGYGSQNFVCVTRQYVRDYKPDVCVFVETRGIWLCWFDHIRIDIIACHFQFIHCNIFSVDGHPSFFATLVVIGDFNATISLDDRLGCSSNSPEPAFHDTVFNCGLHDLGYSGPDFTWYRGNCSVRLDRCFGNALWFENFPRSSLQHLLRMKSDHRPILLCSAIRHASPRSTNFRYFSGWLFHRDFKRLVRDNWDSSIPIMEAVNNFSIDAEKWNAEVFGAIGRSKKILMARLRGVQRILDKRRTQSMLKLELKLLEELEQLLDQEEMLWKHKSRIDWVKFGDRNTRYFHSKAVLRRRRKSICSLRINDGEWCDDESTLREAVVSYYAGLFSTDGSSPLTFPISGFRD